MTSKLWMRDAALVRCILESMTRTGKKAVKQTHQQKLARRFMYVMETLIERNMRIPQEHVSAMLELTPPEMRSLMWLYQHGRAVISDRGAACGVARARSRPRTAPALPQGEAGQLREASPARGR